MGLDLLISIDCQDVPAQEASIPVLDHGFLFGDSVYETIRTWKGRLLFAAEHLERLRASAAGIGLPIPLSDEAYIAEFERMNQRRPEGQSSIRLIVTRGVGELELATGSCIKQRSIIISKPLNGWPDALYSQGGKLSLVSVVRNSRRATNPAFKTGNYLNNILAIEEALKVGATEAVMLNAQGHLTECTTSNVFFVSGGQVCTPALETGILSGITRAKVLALATASGVAVVEGAFTSEDLLAADEVFITSTTRDVMPITQVDEHRIGTGAPGPVTRNLMNAYAALCDRSTGAA